MAVANCGHTIKYYSSSIVCAVYVLLGQVLALTLQTTVDVSRPVLNPRRSKQVISQVPLSSDTNPSPRVSHRGEPSYKKTHVLLRFCY